MDWNQVKGNWRQVRGNVKKQWGKLTDDDLTAIDGRREALEGRIQERYGYTKDRVRKEIEEWQRSFASQLNRSSDELADQIDAIRADILSLTSTVSRIANQQLGRAQDKAIDAATQAEEAIRRNPTSAAAMALGFGFLFRRFHTSIGIGRMVRQSSMSYPGQGRPKDPNLPKDSTGGRQGQGKAAQSEPKLARIRQDKKPKRERSPST